MSSLLAALNQLVTAGPYDYKDAGKDAAEGVKQSIEEFKNLTDEEKSKIPLLYYLLGTGTPEYKMSKEDSAYEDLTTVSGQTCGNCEFAYTKTATIASGDPDHICSQITGRISEPGWCRLWVKADLLKRHPN